MIEGTSAVLLSQAQDAVEKLGVGDFVLPEEVAYSIANRSSYWEKPIPGGERLVLISLFCAVVQREEVFLGSILFNAFLSKAFIRVVCEKGLARAALVANDLEHHYYLVRTASGVENLGRHLRDEVEHTLADLFFGPPDEARGIYGDLGRMFMFRKSDFEPFPVYAVPGFLAAELERAVRKQVRKLLASDSFPGSTRQVLAALAFFYGLTSGGSGDAQSFPSFVEHLVNDSDYDGLLKDDDVKRAFNIAEVSKPAIKASIDAQTYSTAELRRLLSGLLDSLAGRIDGGSTKWLMGFLHKHGKFVALPPDEYVSLLLADVQFGYHLFGRASGRGRVPCRLCNTAEALVGDSYVTMGLNSFRFNNQSPQARTVKVCARCALYSYLAQKLLGTEMVSVGGGKLPQVPKTYNLVFHYGRHTDGEVSLLAERIDLLWSLIRRHRDADLLRREVKKQAQMLAQRLEGEDDSQRRSELTGGLSSTNAQLEAAQAELARTERDILLNYPWISNMGGSAIPTENCVLDTIANLRLAATKIERHVLGLGISGYRMILFVLPQVGRSGAKGQDSVRRRFSDSRVTLTALLSFLRELCECDGPFYYQSLPTLTPDAFRSDTFYVQNERITVRQAHDEYEAVTQLAWKLVRQRGIKGLERKVVLAERLLEDPLSTFAEVMRDSRMLGQPQGSYKRLPGSYRQDWGTCDLTEYAEFIRRLSELRRWSEVAMKVDRKTIDELCPRLFRMLDNLGLLPLQLSAKPSEFEKYPRLLIGSIERYNDVEAGFKEWESRVLREAAYRKEECYLEVSALKQWMLAHSEALTTKANVGHLSTSLYARLFQHVYPRRVLANVYCQKRKGEPEVVGGFNKVVRARDQEARQAALTDLEQLLDTGFLSSVEPNVLDLARVYDDDWQTIVADSKKNLLANAAYYRRVLLGEQTAVVPEGIAESEVSEDAEEE